MIPTPSTRRMLGFTLKMIHTPHGGGSMVVEQKAIGSLLNWMGLHYGNLRMMTSYPSQLRLFAMSITNKSFTPIVLIPNRITDTVMQDLFGDVELIEIIKTLLRMLMQ